VVFRADEEKNKPTNQKTNESAQLGVREQYHQTCSLDASQHRGSPQWRSSSTSALQKKAIADLIPSWDVDHGVFM